MLFVAGVPACVNILFVLSAGSFRSISIHADGRKSSKKSKFWGFFVSGSASEGYKESANCQKPDVFTGSSSRLMLKAKS